MRNEKKMKRERRNGKKEECEIGYENLFSYYYNLFYYCSKRKRKREKKE